MCSQEFAYYTECSFLSFLATFQVYEWKIIIGNIKIWAAMEKVWGGMEKCVRRHGKSVRRHGKSVRQHGKNDFFFEAKWSINDWSFLKKCLVKYFIFHKMLIFPQDIDFQSLFFFVFYSLDWMKACIINKKT